VNDIAPAGTGADADTAATPAPSIGGSMVRARFGVALAVIVVAGLAGRVAYVLAVTRHESNQIYDAFWYGYTAFGLSLHQFFREPFAATLTAAHPPLTSLLLAPSCFFFGFPASLVPQRMTMAILGAGVVLCVGLLGRSLAGPRVGLVAAALAATAPNFWIPNGILMSETPAMLGMALILLAIVRLRRRPTVVSVALIGAACGAEALVRAELILFVPFLLLPAALTARPASWPRRIGLLTVGVLAAAVVLAPWVGRNLATFRDPTYISTGDGLALLGANCPSTYSGPELGFWDIKCADSVPSKGDESVQAAADQHAAITYAEHHRDRLPVVVAARVGRLWDFYEPIQMTAIDVHEGRPRPEALAGLFVYYALLPFAGAGLVIMRRRRCRPWILLVPAGVLTVTSALFYGQVRFRAPFEVCLVVLAAPAFVVLGQSAGRLVASVIRRGRSSPQKSVAGA
jgi:4-amino-4-deoxy-L-arabinose transferase-like glycosyltransferase